MPKKIQSPEFPRAFTPLLFAVFFIIILALIAGIRAVLRNTPTPTSDGKLTEYTFNHTQIPRTPAPQKTSELRGRRGIIREILTDHLVIETTDSYAFPNEHVSVKRRPNTSFVLITIPKIPQKGKEVIRTPIEYSDFFMNDNVFAIGFQDIAASSSFSALRIEKIINP